MFADFCVFMRGEVLPRVSLEGVVVVVLVKVADAGEMSRRVSLEGVAVGMFADAGERGVVGWCCGSDGGVDQSWTYWIKQRRFHT